MGWAPPPHGGPLRRQVSRPGRQQDDLRRFPPAAGAQRHRRGGHRHAPRLARPDLDRRHGGRQGRALRKAHVPLHRRGPRGRPRRRSVTAASSRSALSAASAPTGRSARSWPAGWSRSARPWSSAAAASRWPSGAAWSTPSRRRRPRASTGTCTAGRHRCGPISPTASAARTAATGITREAAWATWASTTSTAFNYAYAKDFTSPVAIEAYAPPAHPEACGMWGWGELTYADGLTLVLESGEWGEPYDRKKQRGIGPEEPQRGRPGEARGHARSRALGEFPRGGEDPEAGGGPRRGRPSHGHDYASDATSPSAPAASSATTR